MTALPYINSGSAVTVFLAGVPHALAGTHPNFDTILDMIRNGELTDDRLDEIRKLVDHRAAIEEKVKGVTYGKVTVGQDAILLNGSPIHSYLATKMVDMLGAGHDVAPWAKFMDKLYNNPSKTAVDELFLWLEKAQMPITPEGNFLAYKKVQDDFSSYHKGPNGLTVFNRVGDVVEMIRNEVDDDRNRTCSAGLHFCSWHYLPSYYGGRGKVVILEIDPGDVVSIPSDYDNAKGRAWRYVVKGVIPEKDAQFAFDGQPLYAGDYSF